MEDAPDECAKPDPQAAGATGQAGADTREIVALAEALADAGPFEHASLQSRFLARYRAWILHHRGMAEEQPVWAERNLILLHLMVSGATLRDAIEIKKRFVNPVWGSESRMGLIDHGETLEIHFDEPVDGLESFISTSWLLSITACQLEFLVGHRLDMLRATLRQGPMLAPALAHFFLPRATTYRGERNALLVARADLASAVSVTSAQIPAFLENIMRLSINAQVRERTIDSVENFLWREITRHGPNHATMPTIAAGLGVSEATLRRRLDAEGTSFRRIRMRILDRLAKMWLRETDLAHERIAERLGYSDAFSFRRAFRRVNGSSPAAYRGEARRLRSLP